VTAESSTGSERLMMLSIHPRHVAKILDGSKKVELRRTRPVVEVGQPVVIYATVPSAAVVASCTVAEIRTGTPAEIWSMVSALVGVSRAEYNQYFAGSQTAVAIYLEDVEALADQVTLTHLRSTGPFHPPQTWHFLDRARLHQLLGRHPAAPSLSRLLNVEALQPS